MVIDDLRAYLDELARAPGLWEPEAFAARAAALDRLELLTLGHDAGPAEGAGLPLVGRPRIGPISVPTACASPWAEAAAMEQRLAEANRALCAVLRGAIRSGGCRGSEARRTLERLGGRQEAGATSGEDEYDLLDVLVSELLMEGEAPAPTLPAAAERTPYQPTPARVVLELLDRLALGHEDLFYDLGSGLGNVSLLVHLLSGAPARGIEVEPAYCHYARRQARALGLAGVEFVEGDARAASLAGGTCYFLYAPFTGRTLAAVLDRLAEEARDRPITLAAYGPCVADVTRRPWLKSTGGRRGSGLAILRSEQ